MARDAEARRRRAGRRHRPRRQRQHGARHSRRVGRARPRSAPVRAGRVRRRRRHARVRDRRAARHRARSIVPRHAGVLSALGMLVADVTRDYSRQRAAAERRAVARAICASASRRSWPQRDARAGGGGLPSGAPARSSGSSTSATSASRTRSRCRSRRTTGASSIGGTGGCYGYSNPRARRRRS